MDRKGFTENIADYIARGRRARHPDITLKEEADSRKTDVALATRLWSSEDYTALRPEVLLKDLQALVAAQRD